MRLLGNQIRLSKNAAAELDLTGGGGGGIRFIQAFWALTQCLGRLQHRRGTFRRRTEPPPPDTHGSERLTHTIFYEEHTRFYCGPNSAPQHGGTLDPSRTRYKTIFRCLEMTDPAPAGLTAAPPPLLSGPPPVLLDGNQAQRPRLEPRQAGLPPVHAPLLSDVSALPVC